VGIKQQAAQELRMKLWKAEESNKQFSEPRGEMRKGAKGGRVSQKKAWGNESKKKKRGTKRTGQKRSKSQNARRTGR